MAEAKGLVDRGGRGVVKPAAVPGCELKCIFFLFLYLPFERTGGRLDYQSGAASGTFFSVGHVGRRT